MFEHLTTTGFVPDRSASNPYVLVPDSSRSYPYILYLTAVGVIHIPDS